MLSHLLPNLFHHAALEEVHTTISKAFLLNNESSRMLPVLKGMRFNYPEQSLRQNNLPDYPFTQLHFKSPVSEPSGSSGQYVPPAWQCRVGVPTTEGFTSLQGPCLRRCRTWPAEDPVETRTCSSKSTGSKSLCLWYWGFIFPFDAVMGDVQEEIPSSSTDSRFTEQCDNVCLVFQTAEEEKKNVFYGFMKTETLICFVWGLSLF